MNADSAGFLDQRQDSTLGTGHGIISLRGAKLTYRVNEDLWVVLAGDAPRAWHLRLNHSNKQPKQGAICHQWSERRPAADDLLQGPEKFAAERKNLVTGLRSHVTLLHESGRMLSNSQMFQQRETLRNLRKLGYLTRWLQQFPPDALHYLDRHHFREQRWHLLNLWLRVPQGREFFDDIPALAWMLSASWRYKRSPVKRPLRSLRALATKPRWHILRWLDLPEGEGTLRLLGRYRGKMMNKRLAHALCIVLRNEGKRRILHNLAKPPDYKQLRLLAYDMPISFDLLRAINEGETCGQANHQMPVQEIYFDTLNMIRRLDDPTQLAHLGRIRSAERLRHWHDQMMILNPANMQPGMSGDCQPFSLDSPLVVPEWLVPIHNNQSLICEALEMNHCVHSYAGRIAARYYYVYAVHHPQGRATLGIQRGENGHWAFSQLYGHKNSHVPEELHADIRSWLRNQVLSPSDQEVSPLMPALTGQANIFGYVDDDNIPF